MRTIISLLYLLFYFAISAVALPLEWLIGKKNKELELRQSCAMIKWGFSCLTFLAGAKVTVKGAENIPKNGPLLFMGNHRSYYDIIIAYQYLPFFTSVIAKSGLRKAPVIGLWMKRIEVIFLENNNMKQQMQSILTGIDMLNNGKNLLIFPEGKRNKGSGVDEFHAGSFKLATKTGATIVPFSITNTREIWETQFPWLKSQNVVLEFLPPITTKDISKDESKLLHVKTHDVIFDSYKANGGY